MDVLCCPADARKAVRSLRSAPRGSRIAGFPKRVRILRSKDFRRVYDEGKRYTCPLFAAFCLRRPEGDGPRVGFTVPRALGGAVTRNRIRRRVREAVRLRLDRLSPQWEIVFNPRRTAIDAPFSLLEQEIQKLFSRCGES